MFESHLKPPISFPTVSGAVCSFDSQYAGLPLKSHVVQLTATQSGSGTPSPDNVRTINGYSALNIGHYGLNVWGNGITLSDASISGTYKGYRMKYNSNIRMVLFDRDTTQDISGIFLGFSGSGKDATEGIQWVISNGNIFSEGNIFSDTYKYISIYPGTQETLDKIFNRFYVLTVIDNGGYSTYVPYVGSNTTITIGSTVYGGEYDARTGLFTVTHVIVDLSTLSWTYQSGNIRFWSTGIKNTVLAPENNNTPLNGLCSHLQMVKYDAWTTNNSICVSQSGDMFIRATDYMTVEDLLTALSGAVLVYPLATPTTIQLPPCPIDTLEVNNIWADTGDTTLQYIKLG